jgi:hypothetical protein
MYVIGNAHILELFTNTILLSRTFDSAVKIKLFLFRQKLYQAASTLYTAANQVTGKLIYKLGFYLLLCQWIVPKNDG